MVGARAPGTEQLASFFDVSKRGVGGLPTGAGLVDRAVNQGPWLQERVGGGRRGLDGSFKEGAGRSKHPRLGLGGGPRASVPGG